MVIARSFRNCQAFSRCQCDYSTVKITTGFVLNLLLLVVGIPYLQNWWLMDFGLQLILWKYSYPCLMNDEIKSKIYRNSSTLSPLLENLLSLICRNFSMLRAAFIGTNFTSTGACCRHFFGGTLWRKFALLFTHKHRPILDVQWTKLTHLLHYQILMRILTQIGRLSDQVCKRNPILSIIFCKYNYVRLSFP